MMMMYPYWRKGRAESHSTTGMCDCLSMGSSVIKLLSSGLATGQSLWWQTKIILAYEQIGLLIVRSFVGDLYLCSLTNT